MVGVWSSGIRQSMVRTACKGGLDILMVGAPIELGVVTLLTYSPVLRPSPHFYLTTEIIIITLSRKITIFCGDLPWIEFQMELFTKLKQRMCRESAQITSRSSIALWIWLPRASFNLPNSLFNVTNSFRITDFIHQCLIFRHTSSTVILIQP